MGSLLWGDMFLVHRRYTRKGIADDGKVTAEVVPPYSVPDDSFLEQPVQLAQGRLNKLPEDLKGEINFFVAWDMPGNLSRVRGRTGVCSD